MNHWRIGETRSTANGATFERLSADAGKLAPGPALPAHMILVRGAYRGFSKLYTLTRQLMRENERPEELVAHTIASDRLESLVEWGVEIVRAAERDLGRLSMGQRVDLLIDQSDKHGRGIQDHDDAARVVIAMGARP